MSVDGQYQLQDDDVLAEDDTMDLSENFLPFLLQAQDMIAKLEARVMSLEADLSTVHQKYERDREDWLVGLAQKDQYIHRLSSRLQKTQFSCKEAIVVLSDMTSDDPNIALCLSYLRQAQQPSHPPHIAHAKDEQPDDAVDVPSGCDLVWPMRQPSVDWTEGTTDSDLLSVDSRMAELSTLQDEPPSDQTSVSTKPSLSYSAAQPTLFCANCRQLVAQLDQQIEQKAYLKRDLGSLANALSEESRRVSMVANTKSALEEDALELTSHLFSALNDIMMDDITHRDTLVQLHRETQGGCMDLVHAWDVRDSRLKRIKEYLIELDTAVHRSLQVSVSPSDPPSDVAESVPSGHVDPEWTCVRGGLEPVDESTGVASIEAIRVDGLVFDEFREHLKMATSSTTATVGIPSSVFMKRILAEDVDPCLFQNTSQSWWKSPWFKRKLMDAIAKNQCDIQSWYTHHPQDATTSSNESRISTSSLSSPLERDATSTSTSTVALPPKTRCTCCGALRVCEFLMRLHATSSSIQAAPWLPIDRFCRDRLVAVCDLYSFLSHLGKNHGTSELSLFRQVMHWRRRMALAKVGTLGLFDDHVRPSALPRRSSRPGSVVFDHSGSSRDRSSVISMSDLPGLQGTSHIVIVH